MKLCQARHGQCLLDATARLISKGPIPVTTSQSELRAAAEIYRGERNTPVRDRRNASWSPSAEILADAMMKMLDQTPVSEDGLRAMSSEVVRDDVHGFGVRCGGANLVIDRMAEPVRKALHQPTTVLINWLRRDGQSHRDSQEATTMGQLRLLLLACGEDVT